MRLAALIPTALAAVVLVAMPSVSRAALSTCGGNIQLGYVAGPNFPNMGDVVRVQVTLGAGSIQNGTALIVNRFRFDLDCTNMSVGTVPCTDDGLVMGYGGDGTIASDCLDHVGGTPITWSTRHAAGGSPNEVVFTPNAPISVSANTSSYCAIEFDLTVLGHSNDATPNLAEESAGYNASGMDARCDNGLASSTAQSGSIPLCQVCDDGDPCTSDACDSDTDECIFTPVDCGSTTTTTAAPTTTTATEATTTSTTATTSTTSTSTSSTTSTTLRPKACRHACQEAVKECVDGCSGSRPTRRSCARECRRQGRGCGESTGCELSPG